MSNRRTVAMVANDDFGRLIPRGARKSIASMLAPTENVRRNSHGPDTSRAPWRCWPWRWTSN
ncbi:hypothetical protein DM828_13435 [Pseudomonas umsongensis]|nr:hypothetical protein [Pseudomonas umsongensis]